MKNRKIKRQVSRDDVVTSLDLKPSGGKGWYTSDTLKCPECNKADGKFGLKLVDDSGLCNCWRCGFKASIFTYLNMIGRSDLIENNKKYNYSEELDNKFLRQREVEPVPEEKLPLGFEEISYHSYLDKRGFTAEQYDQFKVGITESAAEPAWRGKVIFQIFNNGRRVGILGRSTKSKAWHDENMRKHREEGTPLKLRYKNSDGDFNYILGGLDDITDKTSTVIVVEGIMDKANIDRLLEVDKQEDVRCVFTFGSSISKEQISLIKAKKSVDHIIVFFDAGTLTKVREYVAELQSTFPQVSIAFIDTEKHGEEIDAGDIDINVFMEVLDDMKSPDDFYGNMFKRKSIRNV